MVKKREDLETIRAQTAAVGFCSSTLKTTTLSEDVTA